MAKGAPAARRTRALRKRSKPPVDLKQENTGLRRELAKALEQQAATNDEKTRLLAELDEALHQQTATADVLKVISRSTFNLQPVFDAIAENAVRICQADRAFIFRFDGEYLRAVAYYNAGRDLKEFVGRNPIAPGRHSISARAAQERRTVHVHDVQADPEYAYAVRDVDLIRTVLAVPMLKGDDLVGIITIYRLEIKPFTDKQVTLVETFADQAVIAIENARLLGETREALEQQTATADVLGVINSSPGDLAPVFDSMLEKALRLCQAAFGIMRIYDGTSFQLVAERGVPEAFLEFAEKKELGTGAARAIESKRVVHIVDLIDTDVYRSGDPWRRAIVEHGGARTILWVPLLKDDAVRGIFTIYRQEVRPFSDKQIALLQNFAAQAVIAMENARLITETREALEQQTATSEVLQVINSSPGDLEPVFDATLDKALRLCEAVFGFLRTYDGANFHLAAHRGVPPAFAEFLTRYETATSISLGTLARGAPVVHIADAAATEDYQSGDPLRRAVVDLGGARTLLAVPLRKDGTLLGAFVIYRQEVRPFSDKQIALLQNFAAQAVIAMENARLITETREALEQQTATAQVLQVINSSPGDLAPVFDAILEKAHSLCAVDHGSLQLYDGVKFRAVATHGLSTEFEARVREGYVPGPQHQSLRLLGGARFAQADVAEIDDPITRAAVELSGIRTSLCIPLRKDETLLGQIVAQRREVKPFTEKEIALLENFAAQAVIAMENARLITETRDALDQQTATAEVLQVINSSPGNLSPVFKAMLEKATQLCGAGFGTLWIYDGERFAVAATHAVPAALAEFVREPVPVTGSASLADIVRGQNFVHIPDMAATELYHAGNRIRRAYVDLGGARSLISVALRKDNALLGAFNVYRQEVRPFSDKEIALVQNFAAQAVIAMENARLITETREALEQQTATAEVLQVINSSPGDLAPVFGAILEKAHSLCAVELGGLMLYDGAKFRAVAVRGVSAAFADRLRQGYFPGPNHPSQQLLEGARFAQITDWAEIDHPNAHAALDAGLRTTLFIPLRKDGTLLGQISANRREVKPFTEKEIALLESFAAQAVIAIENARLLGELRQRTTELARSVDELTATGDVLKIISRSSVNLETVLDTLVETVARLCRADLAYTYRRRGDAYQLVAAHGLSEESKEFVRTHPLALDRGTVAGRVGLDRVAVHVPDVLQDPEHTYREGQKLAGYRSILGIPLLREDTLVGIFAVARTRVEPFTNKEIELATSFADQAVIAIENARLFDELRDRQAELARSVDELTATSDVLKIISRSSVDLETVLDTLVETVARLCRADLAAMYRRHDDMFHLIASRGLSKEQKAFFETHPLASDRGSLSGRVAIEHRAVHIPDVLEDPGYTFTFREGQKVGGYRTMLGIPLLRGDELIGHFNILRTRVDPFTDKEIELATTFADQAVIAIENARLFDELRERQAELRVTFDNMGDGVAMFGADTHLAAWNRNLQEMLDLPDAILSKRPSYAELFRYLAERGEFGSADLEAELRRSLEDTKRDLRFERTRPDGRVVEVRRNPVPGGGFVLIYADITERKRAEETIRAARDAAESALRELQTAQASLVHAQKMAALGQLTAGIAHEIKNPLNFVNNFAGLSVELLDELKQASAQAMGALDAGKRAEIVETIGMLTSNLEKIAEHGRRADGIVKSMLQHSRGGSGDWQATDLNALVEEALNLAYHGARAQDQSFNITMERDFDRNLAPIAVVPQDVMRVFLNLIGNGFYAANKRRQEGDGTFRPVLKVTTRELGNAVEIGVRDNGVGISPEHREKLFQPFFTTKPTGEGTGLGLSISYEIVTQLHGGTITVASEVGEFTEFTVRLPRRQHPAGARAT